MCFKPLNIRIKYEEMQRDFPHFLSNKPDYVTYNSSYYPVKYRQVQCGKCLDCTKKYSRNWVFRLKEESKWSTNETFITLTYRDESLQPENFHKDFLILSKKHLRTFVKTVKQKQKRILKQLDNFLTEIQPEIKYYACGEYGGKMMRPHYHIIFFNLLPIVAKELNSISYDYKKGDTWKYGNVKAEPISKIHYVTKYLGKDHFPENCPKESLPFNIMSPNLGKDYATDIAKLYQICQPQKLYEVPVKDYKIPMPDYYKKKLFNEHQLPLVAENTVKKYQERIKRASENMGLSPEQYEALRQKNEERKYKRKKLEFLNK